MERGGRERGRKWDGRGGEVGEGCPQFGSLTCCCYVSSLSSSVWLVGCCWVRCRRWRATHWLTSTSRTTSSRRWKASTLSRSSRCVVKTHQCVYQLRSFIRFCLCVTRTLERTLYFTIDLCRCLYGSSSRIISKVILTVRTAFKPAIGELYKKHP